ncbi:hypothetical protein [Acidisoma silvae]|uniref:Uncharacterized protein n=1 Tax=Acidisoma silvae TaxID=2802396 RepID=A0A963YSE7_9PROT|nr:hypothetical protein [Acidisoma silvae]MCB8876070.1 hypothetical protein [Acidisoma silvae]
MSETKIALFPRFAVSPEQKNAFSTCVKFAQTTIRQASAVIGTVPVPAVVKKHVSKKDAAFIAAAYAIPLPGTGLLAAIIVAGKLAVRHRRSRWQRLPVVGA